MGKDVIIACDFPGREETMKFLDQFGEERPFVKIGMELYYSAGPDMVRELKERGHKVFLDLKLHDIPNTVRKTMAVLSGLGADIVNVHASGTIAMMEAALEGVTRPDGSRPQPEAVAQGLADIFEATLDLDHAFAKFPDFKKDESLLKETKAANDAEDRGDVVYRDGLAAIFRSDLHTVDILKWKSLLDKMENTLDACKNVANEIQNVIVKNG